MRSFSAIVTAVACGTKDGSASLIWPECRLVAKHVPGVSSSSAGAQAIAGAAHSVQQRVLELLVDLLPQAADMYVDDVGLRVEMVVPHIFQQHRPGYDMTGVAHQVFQELKLPRQEFDDLVAALHRAGQQIELQIGDAKPGLGRTLGATAEQCLDAR